MKKINGQDLHALKRTESIFNKLDNILDEVSNKNALSDEAIKS